MTGKVGEREGKRKGEGLVERGRGRETGEEQERGCREEGERERERAWRIKGRMATE